MSAARKGLGRGLESIFADDGTDEPLAPREGPAILSLTDIAPDPNQPRKSFTVEELEELSSSIRERGVLQPILVRPVEDGKVKYLIIAGERRWRAAARAKVHEIPVIIRDTDEGLTAELALIENIQRTDLNPIEEADAYVRMKDTFGRSAQDIAKSLGKSRSHIANMMRLAALPDNVRSFVIDGQLSMGHARALLSAEDPSSLAEDVIKKKLSVRETELLVGSGKKLRSSKKEIPSKGLDKSNRKVDADTKSLENDLEAALGIEVMIDHSKKGGTVTLSYGTLDQLDDICRRLMGTTV